MEPTAIVVIEGVLVHDAEVTLPALVGTDAAVRLWSALRQFYNTHLLSSRYSVGDIREWLGREMAVTPAANVLSPPPELRRAALSELMPWAVDNLRGRGLAVGLTVCADPKAAAASFRTGVLSLYVASPVYLRPEFRPNALDERQPWHEIVESLDEARGLRAEDARLEHDEYA